MQGMILVLMMRIFNTLCLEIRNQKSKNIFINTIYRQPSGNKENFENCFSKFLEKNKNQDNLSSW